MKYRAIALCSLFISASSAAFSTSAMADDIEVITVSSTPVSLDEAGSSITVIPREEIERRSLATLQDLLREVPGFAVSQSGSLSAVTQVRVRGAEANQVLVLLNGIEINDPAQGSEFDFSQVVTQDIERIEIVRGPQSALWGSDAMAGVVNIITLPTGDGTGVEAAAEAGSFSTSRARVTARHASERNRIKFTADYLDTNGTNISRQGREDDGLENLTLGLSGELAPGDNVKVAYTLRHTRRTSAYDDVDFIATGLPVDAVFDAESDALYGGLTIAHELSDRFSHQLALQLTDTENTSQTGAVINDETRGRKEAARYRFNVIGDEHRLSVSLEHESESFEQRGLAAPWGDPNQNRDATTRSIAAEYRYDGERFNASASWRSDDNSEFDDSQAWRITGNLKVGSDTILFASAGQSTKNPTFTERFGFYTNFVGNPDLKPEASTEWELGIRQELLDGRMDVDLAWFRAELENEIDGFVFDPVTFGFTADNKRGQSDREGAELTVRYRSTERLTLRAGYTYLDATEEDASGDDVKEIRRPAHSGFIATAYTADNWGLDVALSYTGTQQDDYFPPFPPFQERVSLDAFRLLSLTGYYDFSDSIRATFRAENVTDEDYEQVFGYASPGSAVYAGIRFRW